LVEAVCSLVLVPEGRRPVPLWALPRGAAPAFPAGAPVCFLVVFCLLRVAFFFFGFFKPSLGLGLGCGRARIRTEKKRCPRQHVFD